MIRIVTQIKNHARQGMALFLCVLLVLGLISVQSICSAAIPSKLSITIMCDGEAVLEKEFSLSELAAMPQVTQLYSSVDPMPAPSMTIARGVTLKQLFSHLGISSQQVKDLSVASSDGWSNSYSSSILFGARYTYSDIVTGWDTKSAQLPSFLEGAQDNKTAVEPMLALKSFSERFSPNPGTDKLSSKNGISFCYGQSSIEEQTMQGFGKYIKSLTVTLQDGSIYQPLQDPIQETSETPSITESEQSKPDLEQHGQTTTGDPIDSRTGVPADTLIIMVGYYGGPYMTKKVFTLDELYTMSQVRQAYTFIDSMPAVVLDSATGVRLTDILESAGIDVNSVEAFHFYCSDVTTSWYQSMTKEFLLDTKRYYYPNLQRYWDMRTNAASDKGREGAIEVETIIALEDNWQRFAETPDFSESYIDTRFRLLFGQTDVSTTTAARSARWIHSIEVMLGGTPPKGVTLDKSALDLEVGSTYQLSAQVEKIDHTTDTRVEWLSSNPDVISVDQNGKVQVLKDGEATISVATVVGGKTAICVINGEQQEPKQPAAQSGEQAASAPNQRPPSDTGEGEAQALFSPTTETVNNDSDAGVQNWRVHEMSNTAIALPDIQEENPMLPYAGGAAVCMVLLGGGLRIKKYFKEV